MRQVREMEAISSRLTSTRTPDGSVIRLPPMAVDLDDGVSDLPFAPSYSEHTHAILEESGLAHEEIGALAGDGIIPS
jgi:hypothetical protein